MSKPKKPRKPKMNIDACVEMAAFRQHMRSMAADRAAFAKANAPWRRIASKLAALVIVGGITSVIIAHAMAYNAGPVLLAHID